MTVTVEVTSVFEFCAAFSLGVVRCFRVLNFVKCSIFTNN